jgi:hypothetical protein
VATKTPSFSQIIDKASEAVQSLEQSYQPTDQERRLRATFWTALEDHPVADADTINPTVVEQLTNDSRIRKWWSKPGFQSWFLCKSEVQGKAEYALDLLLDSFIEIALSDDPKSYGAKVAAAKLLADMRGYSGKVKKAAAIDADIPVERDQLEAFVKKLQLQAASNK